jgi:hypothetical protein
MSMSFFWSVWGSISELTQIFRCQVPQAQQERRTELLLRGQEVPEDQSWDLGPVMAALGELI